MTDKINRKDLQVCHAPPIVSVTYGVGVHPRGCKDEGMAPSFLIVENVRPEALVTFRSTNERIEHKDMLLSSRREASKNEQRFQLVKNAEANRRESGGGG